ncbi:hypothetical protein Cgig2_016570 [Carnegiea gigantea]|uniref:Uncharacterized protein n=1 Tax=Carnegiea gigantea TaxID=171969 RepID=A0A9Q1KZY8_9CARY|nr:hypothetical protein Cgig2_016570 [Carnegiea gigantea]
MRRIQKPPDLALSVSTAHAVRSPAQPQSSQTLPFWLISTLSSVSAIQPFVGFIAQQVGMFLSSINGPKNGIISTSCSRPTYQGTFQSSRSSLRWCLVPHDSNLEPPGSLLPLQLSRDWVILSAVWRSLMGSEPTPTMIRLDLLAHDVLGLDHAFFTCFGVPKY